MLRVELIDRKGAIEICLEGILNIETKKLFDKVLINKVLINKTLTENAKVIGVNMIGVRSLDSSGLGVLIKARNLCTNENKQVVIYGASPLIQNVFNYARLESIFNFQKKEEFESLHPHT